MFCQKSEFVTYSNTKHIFRFQVRTLLFLQAVVGLAVAVIVSLGHLALFAGLVMSLFGTLFLVLLRRIVMTPRSWTVVSATICCAIIGFFVSFGPASGLVARLDTVDHPFPMALETYRIVYRPVVGCLHDTPKSIRDAGLAFVEWCLPPDVQINVWDDGFGWWSDSKKYPGTGLTFTIVNL